MTGFTDMLIKVAREEKKVVIELIKSRIGYFCGENTISENKSNFSAILL